MPRWYECANEASFKLTAAAMFQAPSLDARVAALLPGE